MMAHIFSAVEEVKNNLNATIKLFCWSSENEPKVLNETWTLPLWPAIAEADTAANSPLLIKEKGGFHDKLVYIYTSGTTGLPKAAVVTNSR